MNFSGQESNTVETYICGQENMELRVGQNNYWHFPLFSEVLISFVIALCIQNAVSLWLLKL